MGASQGICSTQVRYISMEKGRRQSCGNSILSKLLLQTPKKQLRVSFFEGDYCTFKPISVGKESPTGAFASGKFEFSKLQKIKCSHPHFWPGYKQSTELKPGKKEPMYDTRMKPGVGIKVTIWPHWKDGRPFPYSQIPCETPEEAATK